MCRFYSVSQSQFLVSFAVIIYPSYHHLTQIPTLNTPHTFYYLLKSFSVWNSPLTSLVEVAMTSSLAKQLTKLQQRPAHDDKLNHSFLFTPQEALKLSREQIHELAIDGLRTLVAQDNRFDQFIPTLFDSNSIRKERKMLTKPEAAQHEAQVEKILTLLAPHFFEVPAHQVLEYLIRVHEVHTFSVTSLLRAFLPYHDHGLFVRLLLLLDLRNTGLDFLSVNQLKGAPLPRSALVTAAAENPKVLMLITESVEFSLKYNVANNAALSLWVGVATALANSVEGEAIFRSIATTLIQWLPGTTGADVGSAAAGSVAAGAMIVLCTWSSETTFSVKMLSALVLSLVKGLSSRAVVAPQHILGVLAHVFNSQVGVVNQAPFGDTLTTLTHLPWTTLAALLPASIGRTVVSALVHHNLKTLQLSHSRQFLVIAADEMKFRDEDVADTVEKIALSLPGLADDEKDELLKAIRSLSRRFPNAFDAAIAATLSAVDKKKKDSVPTCGVDPKTAVRQLVTAYLTGAKYQYLSIPASGSTQTNTTQQLPLSTCLLSHNTAIRKLGLEHIQQHPQLIPELVDLLAHTLEHESVEELAALAIKVVNENIDQIIANQPSAQTAQVIEALLSAALTPHGKSLRQVVDTGFLPLLRRLAALAKSPKGLPLAHQAIRPVVAFAAIRLGLVLVQQQKENAGLGESLLRECGLRKEADAVEALECMNVVCKVEAAAALGAALQSTFQAPLTGSLQSQLKSVTLQLAVAATEPRVLRGLIPSFVERHREVAKSQATSAVPNAPQLGQTPWVGVMATSVRRMVAPSCPQDQAIDLLYCLHRMNVPFPHLTEGNGSKSEYLSQLYLSLLAPTAQDAAPASEVAEVKATGSQTRHRIQFPAELFHSVAAAMSEFHAKVDGATATVIANNPVALLLPLLGPAQAMQHFDTATKILRGLQSVCLAAGTSSSSKTSNSVNLSITARNSILEFVSVQLDLYSGATDGSGAKSGKRGDLTPDAIQSMLQFVSACLTTSTKVSLLQAACVLDYCFVSQGNLQPVVRDLGAKAEQLLNAIEAGEVSADAISAAVTVLTLIGESVAYTVTGKKHLMGPAAVKLSEESERLCARFLSVRGASAGTTQISLQLQPIVKSVLRGLSQKMSKSNTDTVTKLAELWRHGCSADVVRCVVDQYLQATAVTQATPTLFMDIVHWCSNDLQSMSEPAEEQLPSDSQRKAGSKASRIESAASAKASKQRTEEAAKKSVAGGYRSSEVTAFDLLELLSDAVDSLSKQSGSTPETPAPSQSLADLSSSLCELVPLVAALPEVSSFTSVADVKGSALKSVRGLQFVSATFTLGSTLLSTDGSEAVDMQVWAQALASLKINTLSEIFVTNDVPLAAVALKAMSSALGFTQAAATVNAEVGQPLKMKLLKKILSLLAETITLLEDPNAAPADGQSAAVGRLSKSVVVRLLQTVLPFMKGATGSSTSSKAADEDSFLHVPIVSLLLRLAPMVSDAAAGPQSAFSTISEVLLSFETDTTVTALSGTLKLLVDPSQAYLQSADKEMYQVATKLLKADQVTENKKTILRFVLDIAHSEEFLRRFVVYQESRPSRKSQDPLVVARGLILAAVDVFANLQQGDNDTGRDQGDDPQSVSFASLARKLLGAVLRSSCMLLAMESCTELLTASNGEIRKVALEAMIDRFVAEQDRLRQRIEDPQGDHTPLFTRGRTAHKNCALSLLKQLTSLIRDLLKTASDGPSRQSLQLCIILCEELLRGMLHQGSGFTQADLAEEETVTDCFNVLLYVGMRTLQKPSGGQATTQLLQEHLSEKTVPLIFLGLQPSILLGSVLISAASFAEHFGLHWMAPRASDTLTLIIYALKAASKDVKLHSLRVAALTAIWKVLPSVWVMIEPFLPSLLASLSNRHCSDDAETAKLSQQVLQSLSSLLEPRVLLPQISGAIARSSKENSLSVLFGFVKEQIKRMSKKELRPFDDFMSCSLFTKAFEAISQNAAAPAATGTGQFVGLNLIELEAVLDAMLAFSLLFKEKDVSQFVSRVVEWGYRLRPGDDQVDLVQVFRWIVLMTFVEFNIRKLGTLFEFALPTILGPFVDLLLAAAQRGGLGKGLKDDSITFQQMLVEVALSSVNQYSELVCKEQEETSGKGLVIAKSFFADPDIFEKVLPALASQVSNYNLFGAQGKAQFSQLVAEKVSPAIRSFIRSLNSPKLWSQAQHEILRALRSGNATVRKEVLNLFELIYTDGGDQMASVIMAEALPTFVEATEDRSDEVVDAARKLCLTLSNITGQDVLHAMS